MLDSFSIDELRAIRSMVADKTPVEIAIALNRPMEEVHPVINDMMREGGLKKKVKEKRKAERKAAAEKRKIERQKEEQRKLVRQRQKDLEHQRKLKKEQQQQRRRIKDRNQDFAKMKTIRIDAHTPLQIPVDENAQEAIERYHAFQSKNKMRMRLKEYNF